MHKLVYPICKKFLGLVLTLLYQTLAHCYQNVQPLGAVISDPKHENCVVVIRAVCMSRMFECLSAHGMVSGGVVGVTHGYGNYAAG